MTTDVNSSTEEGAEPLYKGAYWPRLPRPMAEQAVRVGHEDGEEGGEGPDHEGGQEVCQQGGQVGEGVGWPRRVDRQRPAHIAQLFTVILEQASSIINVSDPDPYSGRNLSWYQDQDPNPCSNFGPDPDP